MKREKGKFVIMHQQTEVKMSCLYIPENGRIFYNKVGDCETGLVFDVQKRQMPDFVGDK